MSLGQKNAAIIFDRSQQSPESLSEAIEDMGFESTVSETTTVSVDTQVILTSNLEPAAQQEALKKLAQIHGVLDVREAPARMGLSVTFVPSLTTFPQLSEVVASLFLESQAPGSPKQKAPTLSPSHTVVGGVSLLKLCIEGMTCHSCTTTIEGKIGKLKGIEKIKGDVPNYLTIFRSCISSLSSERSAMLQRGYTLYRKELSCHCDFQALILANVVMFLLSTVVLETQEAAVVYLPHLITVQTITDQIAVAGFKAFVKTKPHPLQLSSSEIQRFVDSEKQTICSPSDTSEETEIFIDTTPIMLRVKGMHCRSCVVNIQDNLSKLPGVSSVEVSLEKERASICYDPLKITVLQLQQAIEALPPGNFRTQPWDSPDPVRSASTSPGPDLLPAGSNKARPASSEPCFTQPLLSVITIHIEGMTCNSCVESIEGMMSQKKGVMSAQVSLTDHSGVFEYDPLLTTPVELREAIEDMGFDAFLPGKKIAEILA